MKILGTTSLRKIGNSEGVILGKEVMESLGFKLGDKFIIKFDANNRLILVAQKEE